MYVIANEATKLRSEVASTKDSWFCVTLYNLNFWPYLIVPQMMLLIGERQPFL